MRARSLSPSLVQRRVCGARACERASGARVGATTSTVAEASQVVNDRTGWVMPMRHIALAIGRLETDFGTSGSWLMADGSPSYNWGALVGSGTAGSITHGDKTAEGAPVTAGFQAFHSMPEGFDAFRRVWTRGDVGGDKSIPHEATVIDAASRGDALSVARTMYAHRYFTGIKGTDDDRILAYANAIVGSAAEIARQLGEPASVTLEAPPASSSAWKSILIPVAIIGAGIGVLIYGEKLRSRWEYYTT